MELSAEELRYLRERKEDIEAALEDLSRPMVGPQYHDAHEKRLDLMDELEEVNAELKRQGEEGDRPRT